MNETCDRCGPAVPAACRVARDGEPLPVRTLREPAIAGAVRAGLERQAHRRASACAAKTNPDERALIQRMEAGLTVLD